MELINEKLQAIAGKIRNFLDLCISFKGDATVSVHDEKCIECPKAKIDLTEDGKTIKVSTILAVVCAVGAVACIIDFIDGLFD